MAEGLPPVDALRAVLDRVATDNFVLLSGDVVAEASLRVQLLTHYVREAAMTALFGRRKVLATQETKPGRPPKNVDYVGGWRRCRRGFCLGLCDWGAPERCGWLPTAVAAGIPWSCRCAWAPPKCCPSSAGHSRGPGWHRPASTRLASGGVACTAAEPAPAHVPQPACCRPAPRGPPCLRVASCLEAAHRACCRLRVPDAAGRAAPRSVAPRRAIARRLVS